MSTPPRTLDGKFVAGFSYSERTQFVKGQEPANKGKKFPGTGNRESFKKGNLPHNTRYDGAITIRKNSQGNRYKFIRLGNKNWEFLQKHNWIKENGPIPEGKILCCKDGDSLNCDPSNWELKTRSEHATTNRNMNVPEKRNCPICGKEFETKLRKAKYCSDECQREKSRTYMREHQREKREKVERKQNCIVCGVEFTPLHMASKICSEKCHEERQRTYNANYARNHSKIGTTGKSQVAARNKSSREDTIGKCIQCGNQFIKTNAINELCSYRCKRDRRNELRGKWISLKEKKEKVKPLTICPVCGKEFKSEFGMKICSSECRIKASKKYRREYYLKEKASKPKMVKAEKPVKVKAPRPIKVKAITPVKEKPIQQIVPKIKSNGHRKSNEKDAALNMMALNRNAPVHDREILQAKQIESPRISEMPYKVYDKAMKITRFFRTEEKYLNYLKKQENERCN